MDNRGFDQDQFNGGAKAARLHRQSASETVGKKSLGDLAYSEIKRRIINLDFRPGDYLNEASICAKLGMTRSPVHQAMQRLMHEGLVRVIPRKGVFVQPVTFDEVADVIDVRFLNEPYCVERATEAATTAELQEMTRILGGAASMIVARDIEGLMNLDRAFHRAIARAARNVVLADLLSTLHDRSLRFWFISLSDTDHMRQVQEEHLRILDAMERRDGPAAKAEMQGHIKSFRSTISERVQQAAGQ